MHACAPRSSPAGSSGPWSCAGTTRSTRGRTVRETADGGLPLVRDVVQVVNRIVKEVPRERLDGEPSPVAAAPGASPLLRDDRVEMVRDDISCIFQLDGDRAWILLAVAIGDRGRVLVPVREQ